MLPAIEESNALSIRTRLSPYEVPKVIDIRKELPLTVVGKIDKKVLRKEA